MLSKSENLLHKLETNLQQNQKISIEKISMDEKNFVECVPLIETFKTHMNNTVEILTKRESRGMKMNRMFYRIENGNARIFHETGEVVTRIDANVYPVDSNCSARYTHPDGIVLTIADAKKLGIEAE